MLDIFRILLDLSLAILSWTVQLTVYPSFTYFDEKNLIRWHKKYTKGISILVAPLMIAELLLVTFQLYRFQNWFTILSFLLVAFIWLTTFLWAVPLHNEIGAGKNVALNTSKLVKANLPRTIAWTILFGFSLWEYIQ